MIRQPNTNSPQRWNAVVAACVVCVAWWGQFQLSAQSEAPRPASARLADSKQLDRGKELFHARCASCHNDRGDKPLEKGLPLNQRVLTDALIRKNVEPRFAKSSEEDKFAVALYLKSLLTKSSQQR
ncbi:MAG: hypothetical protein HY046_01530 [Acidobacteria bacterium]|nr:hypothetical protein [Acidobacteriota bacterium]